MMPYCYLPIAYEFVNPTAVKNIDVNPAGNSGGSIFGVYNASASKQGTVALGGRNGSASGRWGSVVGGTNNTESEYGAGVDGEGQDKSIALFQSHLPEIDFKPGCVAGEAGATENRDRLFVWSDCEGSYKNHKV